MERAQHFQRESLELPQQPHQLEQRVALKGQRGRREAWQERQELQQLRLHQLHERRPNAVDAHAALRLRPHSEQLRAQQQSLPSMHLLDQVGLQEARREAEHQPPQAEPLQQQRLQLQERQQL